MNSTVPGKDPGILSRRGVLRTSLLAGAAGLFSRGARGQPQAVKPLRFVHMTDIHICAQTRATHGLTAALTSIGALDPKPDFIISGGDHVMDAFGCERALAQSQWDLYLRALDEHCRVPVYPVLGNHDVFGWGNSIVPANPPADYGKAMALARLGLTSPYYSFDRGGWHFINLDNIARRGRHYFGALDPAQTEWLEHDLRSAGTQTPICLTTHIPLLSACVFFDPGTSCGGGAYSIHDSDMHQDVDRMLDIFRPYNLKLALSGHIHLLDRIEYRGTTFICDGALCGRWWQGGWQGCEPGYGVVDLWPSGEFKHSYVPYA